MNLNDGQCRHSGEKHQCFFCFRFKLNCELFRLAERPNHPPEYKALYNNGFVICPECSSKGQKYLEIEFKQWLKNSKYIGLKVLKSQKLQDNKHLNKRK
jgi:hypothetical protein